MTISEMFDKAEDSVKDNILAPPFSWILKNPDVTNGDLRLLKKIHQDSIGIWLSDHGYANNVISRLFAVNKNTNQPANDHARSRNNGNRYFQMAVPHHDPNQCIPSVLLFFTGKGCSYYDTMLFSIHFGCFFLIIFPAMLLSILMPQSLNNLLLSY